MTQADTPADTTTEAPSRRIPVWVTAVTALLVGALLGIGGYALLDRDQRLAATQPAPPGVRYQPVKGPLPVRGPLRVRQSRGQAPDR